MRELPRPEAELGRSRSSPERFGDPVTEPGRRLNRNRFRLHLWGSLLFGLLVIAVSLGRTSTRQDVRLPSGRDVEILSREPLRFSDGASALLLDYQTDVNIHDTIALRAEVLELWPLVRRDVEALKERNAILRANASRRGLFVGNLGFWRFQRYGFVFQQGTDGTWRIVP